MPAKQINRKRGNAAFCIAPFAYAWECCNEKKKIAYMYGCCHFADVLFYRVQ